MQNPATSSHFRVGLVLFPNLTQLDLTGPYEVLSRLPRTTVDLVAADERTVSSERGLSMTPTATFDSAPPIDLLCVPGGVGVNAMMEDDRLLEFLARTGASARYVTSVCTGALLLGAAGLLRGYRATTHWLSLDLLPVFGAIPVEERVVVDRNRITGGGVTAGIDFGLTIAAEAFGREIAEEIQLVIEYDPAPPLQAGSPRSASASLVDRVSRSRERLQADRRAIAQRAARRIDKSTV